MRKKWSIILASEYIIKHPPKEPTTKTNGFPILFDASKTYSTDCDDSFTNINVMPIPIISTTLEYFQFTSSSLFFVT